MDGAVWLSDEGRRMGWSGQIDRTVASGFLDQVPARTLCAVLARVAVVDARDATFVDLGAVHLLGQVVRAHDLAGAGAVRVHGAPRLLTVMCRVVGLTGADLTG